jgi:hypothetical protein
MGAEVEKQELILASSRHRQFEFERYGQTESTSVPPTRGKSSSKAIQSDE